MTEKSLQGCRFLCLPAPERIFCLPVFRLQGPEPGAGQRERRGNTERVLMKMLWKQTVKKSGIGIRDMTYIALFSVLTAVCSWISIPSTVPFTMQTFAVFCALGLLGGRRGTLSVVVYLLLGALGLPVFAGFRGGIGVLAGTTGGYLVGFVFSALTYWGLTSLLGDQTAVRTAAMVLGLLICYAFGTLWFMLLYTRSVGAVSLWTVLGWCVLPFVLPDIIKIALALGLASRLSPLLHL